MSAGKGDTPRPLGVTREEWARRWAMAFGEERKCPNMKAKHKYIFSGHGSKDLWDDINTAETCGQLRLALYALAVHCQELEAVVARLVEEKEQA